MEGREGSIEEGRSRSGRRREGATFFFFSHRRQPLLSSIHSPLRDVLNTHSPIASVAAPKGRPQKTEPSSRTRREEGGAPQGAGAAAGGAGPRKDWGATTRPAGARRGVGAGAGDAVDRLPAGPGRAGRAAARTHAEAERAAAFCCWAAGQRAMVLEFCFCGGAVLNAASSTTVKGEGEEVGAPPGSGGRAGTRGRGARGHRRRGGRLLKKKV